MRLDPAGLPFIGGALVLALVAGAAVTWGLALPFAALAVFFTFFFRDPERRAQPGPHDILAPADGRVLVAGSAVPADAPSPEAWMQVSIFLSPMDVHVNRIPATGRITRIIRTPGRFLPAYRPDAAASNERCEVWIGHDGQTIVARQVVGVLARRVVCRVQEGADVHAGDRFGIMKFGSRMDVFMPPGATIKVAVGDRVRGGETVIAIMKS